MTAAPIHLAGNRLMLDPAGALWWPERKLLAVADLHLEKGSASALKGNLVPPWDTRATLDRLALLIRRYTPRTILALGDSFHDADGANRLMPADATRLRAIAASHEFIWLLGNHDPLPPDGLPGTTAEWWEASGVVFRHQAGGAGPEICGHHHPKASITTRAQTITRPCFVSGPQRLMLPAFGAYTGGLDVRHPAIAKLFPRGGRAFLLGKERLFAFTLGQSAAMQSG
ncbi:ligase-associated DNA damage response endonuclease PdeM [Acidisphaera sp. L21]|uniref:ligase-associated DNA damage response endonuclease PdeM n=1 Tax=Acidisphaera sp. L21 TaxID=1641851 RepID=UPI00131EAB93|nr:ligase-associated DNA damage response endonuclease PdeM [Acidisphaera sp. L21]